MDAKRLMFVMRDIDGFGCVERDKYDFAMEVASENGREEPTAEDELDGVRRLIDEAMHNSGMLDLAEHLAPQ